MTDKIKLAIEKLSPELIAEYNKCLSEGLKDEICAGCGLVFLAHHHFVRCDKTPCPMSNGKTFLDMWRDAIDSNENKCKTNSAIGSQHWYNTLVSQIARIGQFLASEPTPDKDLLRSWGQTLLNNAQHLLDNYSAIPNRLASDESPTTIHDELRQFQQALGTLDPKDFFSPAVLEWAAKYKK